MNTTVKNLFIRFCEVYNLKTSAETRDKNPEQKTYYSNDFIKLDYAPHYGGYRLDVVEKHTGERFFETSNRVSAKEMTAYLRGLIAAKTEWCFEKIAKS